ncbi:MAG: hypothetical protein R3E64_06415 [Halioglobus sp.]
MRSHISPVHAVKRLGSIALALSLYSGIAQADIMFTGSLGDPGIGSSYSYYQNYAFGTALLENGNFTADMGQGTLYGGTTAPTPLNLNSAFNVNGATINATASSVPGGYWTARNAASLNVTNTADENGYYAIGAYGSRTTVQFFSPQALADRAVFHWDVSGVESPSNPATCDLPGLFDDCATGRLDFLATTNTSLTFNDLFSSSNSPLNVFGPGSYSYNIGGMPLNQVISLMYWSSAFVTLNANQTVNGGTFSGFANYSNTFELASIDLFDANNNLITDWTMVDLATQQTVFNQDGQVRNEDIPVPATLMLLLLGLSALRITRRRTA